MPACLASAGDLLFQDDRLCHVGFLAAIHVPGIATMAQVLEACNVLNLSAWRRNNVLQVL